MWYFCISLLLLHPLFSMQRAVHTTPSRLKAVDLNGKTLGAGAPCWVKTFRCGPGLKCVPAKDEPEPLKALLQGRGQCGYANNTNMTEASRVTDTAPTEAPEQAPCRKLLTALLAALGTQRFGPQQEIYLPNCERDGTFKRRQCWSSRGRQRGRCWCVDENGTPLLAANSTQKMTDC